ncbi:glycosyltransferase family 1 protein [Saccharopolyspora erythraea]|uniref:glycosyltransferase n=1 Tax=Saccharopolyspora erythraea TaxID=1836 RepID=UPI001BA8EBA1|nr:glycosyltransferase [Saccharopolyspora erythraea]QUH02896.1 glycosyltransferase family 1 protein [Saccharopolyspora erythraea]
MRVLCTAMGSPSHARAVLPFARALATRGHHVLVATPAHLTHVFDGEPLRTTAVLPDMAATARELMHLVQEGSADPRTAHTELLIALAAGPHATGAARALLPLAEDFAPDLVLRDGAELGGFLVAEDRGIPHLPVPSGNANLLTPERLAPAVDRRRAEAALATPVEPEAIYRYGRLDCIPAAYSFTEPGMPDARRYRQPDLVSRDELLPAWVTELPADRPLVLAALGTALPMLTELRHHGVELPDHLSDPATLLRTIITALSRVSCEAIVVTGGIDPGPVTAPPHIHVTDRVPQPLLLQSTDLFLTHGGYNGIREAVRAGVPMAVLPQFGDQPHNADRVTDLGLGRRCEPDADDITAACEQLLADDKIQATVRHAQRAMLALPDVTTAADDLAGLVEEHRTAG